MAPKMWERSEHSRRPVSIKLFVTLVGALCLGVAFLVITPIYAASGSSVSQATGQKISGGGCTHTDLKPCIHAVKGQVVTEVFVTKSTSEPALVPTCPTSVTLKLFDNTGLVTSTLVGSGCGHFNGPTAPIKAGDTFVVQVSACFSANPADCAAVPSPELTIS